MTLHKVYGCCCGTQKCQGARGVSSVIHEYVEQSVRSSTESTCSNAFGQPECVQLSEEATFSVQMYGTDT